MITYPKILIVDDHLLNITALEQYLNQDYKNISSANTLITAKEKIISEKVDLVLLDLMMENEYSFDLLNFIDIKHSNTKVVVVSSLTNVYYIKRCLKVDVCLGYISKNVAKEILLEGVKNALKGICFTSPDITKQLGLSKSKADNHDRMSMFSPREKEVLSSIYKEETNQEIADLLGISIRTVEVHKRTIQKKIGAKNIVGVIKFVEENNFFR